MIKSNRKKSNISFFCQSFLSQSKLYIQLLWDFYIQTDHLISARRPDLKIINKKKQKNKNKKKKKRKKKQKRTWKIVDFAVPADHRVKLKESEKNTSTLLRNWKNEWNMKVTVILMVIGAVTVTISLFRGYIILEGQNHWLQYRTTQAIYILRN